MASKCSERSGKRYESVVDAAPATAARRCPFGTSVASSIATLMSASARAARGGLVRWAAISASSTSIHLVTASCPG
jgi:hypothetical protein